MQLPLTEEFHKNMNVYEFVGPQQPSLQSFHETKGEGEGNVV